MSASSGPPTQLVLAVHTVEAATAKVGTEAAYAHPTDSFHVSTCCCLLADMMPFLQAADASVCLHKPAVGALCDDPAARLCKAQGYPSRLQVQDGES
jgi:hypothetical protein